MSEPRTPLAGKFLFVAGATLTAQRNAPAQRLPYAVAPYLEHLDLVGFANFYGGQPASKVHKLSEGARNIIFDRLHVTCERNIRRIVARQLAMPRLMDIRIQHKWIHWVLNGILEKSYDVGIIGHAENALLARKLKESGRVRHLIYIDWDYFPGYVEPQFSKLVTRYEEELVKIADGVASVSRPLQELRIRQGAKATNVIPNGVEFDKFHQAYEHRRPHPPTLIYCGSVDARWGIDLGVRALPALRGYLPDLRMIVVGNGPAETELRTLAESLNVLEMIRFVGAVPYEQLPSLMAEADIGLSTSRLDEFRKYASPMKIVEYMAAGLPVVASGGGEAEQMIDESRGGVHIEFTSSALVNAVLPLLQDPAKLASMRTAALNYAQSRTWDHMGRELAKFISEIMRK